MSPHPDNQIADRIAQVLADIQSAALLAGRAPKEIQLLAVSKKQSVSRLQAAYQAGLRDFGENYLQGLNEHRTAMPNDIQWHFIGHIQSKKAKHLIQTHLIHSLDSLKLATLLSKSAQANEVHTKCLININISGQESKSGIAPTELSPLLDEIARLANIQITGLMCIPNPEDSPGQVFSALRKLRDQTQKTTDHILKELSMGMSSSYRQAIAEGSTIVRVGTAIFGPRPS